MCHVVITITTEAHKHTLLTSIAIGLLIFPLAALSSHWLSLEKVHWACHEERKLSYQVNEVLLHHQTSKSCLCRLVT